MKTRKLTALAMLTAAGLMLSYVEALLPSPGVPGVKLGLANTVVIFVLYRYSWREAACVSAVRCTISALLFGTVMSYCYSLAGAALSLAGMALLKKTDRFSHAAVSAAGGVLHNAGQLAAAVLILGTASVGIYAPVLAVSGTLSGLAIGICAGVVLRRVSGGEK